MCRQPDGLLHLERARGNWGSDDVQAVPSPTPRLKEKNKELNPHDLIIALLKLRAELAKDQLPFDSFTRWSSICLPQSRAGLVQAKSRDPSCISNSL